MDKNKIGNEVVSSDFLRVLLALKNNTMRSLNVAEIAQVIKADDDSFMCTLINNKAIQISCISLSDLTISENDIVLVIFTNSDFRTNLKRIKLGQATQDSTTTDLHSLLYGVIVGIIYKENSNE